MIQCETEENSPSGYPFPPQSTLMDPKLHMPTVKVGSDESPKANRFPVPQASLTARARRIVIVLGVLG